MYKRCSHPAESMEIGIQFFLGMPNRIKSGDIASEQCILLKMGGKGHKGGGGG
jgi:hypothetical protein